MRRTKLPSKVWFLIGPDGSALDAYVKKPGEEVLAFAMPMNRSWRDIPTDVETAKKAGYRLASAKL